MATYDELINCVKDDAEDFKTRAEYLECEVDTLLEILHDGDIDLQTFHDLLMQASLVQF